QHWTYSESMLINKPAYSGENAINLNEFSESFSISLDLMMPDTISNLHIETKFQSYFYDKPSALLVLSIENEVGTYIWETKQFDKNQRVMESWFPSKLYFNVKKETIKRNSLLKIYIWNPNRDKGYIDDFGINIYEF